MGLSFATLAAFTVFASSALASSDAAPKRPRLVVVLVVDQMRADYLERYAPFLRGGLARLVDDGLLCTNARQLHAITSTAPGHATIGTGSHPSHHGIISNTLKVGDRFPRAGSDPDAKSLTSKKTGYSSKDLLVDGLGDWLKAADARAHVVTVATKGRSAVMLGGKRPDFAIYVDDVDASFTTSTAYAAALPEWLTQWNASVPARSWLGRTWSARLTASQVERIGLTQDDAPWEGRMPFSEENERTFPHVADEIYDLEFMPFGDERVLGVAREAIARMELGADDATDLLGISFSAADMIGHAYGTWSHELAEYYVWLDEALGAFFAELDDGLRSGRVVVVLSADHGVSPIPEQMIAAGKDAGRIRIGRLKKTIETALDERFGAADWVVDILPDIYLNRAAVAASGSSLDVVAEHAARTAKSIHGIDDAYPRARLLARDGGVPAPFVASFHPERSGDVMLSMRPHWILDYLDSAPYVKANHSTQYDYDQRVPIVFLGGGIAAGRWNAPTGTIDIAPTLAHLVGANPTRAVDGAVLALPRRDGERR
ncbi:MAG: alkaline phosphatase family protein [Planctomycetes bacterium]|nr:alkaline phosphatase family protein [Planctomycetota bacterium]MCC7171821.1 alkaline phosphatase family protein [Planctomycetota bacterium]